ncbi:unnamed protein product [Chondrus crispus]|uniref:Uncharacterized protein n=1 Tax=Chondrus crispus TaxID=2769 RepID=R7QHH8_CHOCR|nr:unnamed protein product [Chondrus crispus]CDF36921.1 unnamed protein product [Chondrus crispus]|eukprot:XP_005716740.1 unnamed protein product [Chondrus crispus]
MCSKCPFVSFLFTPLLYTSLYVPRKTVNARLVPRPNKPHSAHSLKRLREPQTSHQSRPPKTPCSSKRYPPVKYATFVQSLPSPPLPLRPPKRPFPAPPVPLSHPFAIHLHPHLINFRCYLINNFHPCAPHPNHLNQLVVQTSFCEPTLWWPRPLPHKPLAKPLHLSN